MAWPELENNWFHWAGHWDSTTAALSGVCFLLAAAASLMSWLPKSLSFRSISLVGSLLLLLFAASVAVPSPPDLDLWRADPPPFWCMAMAQIILSTPYVFWFWRWVSSEPPIWQRPHCTKKLLGAVLVAELAIANFLSGTSAYREANLQAFDRLGMPGTIQEDYAEHQRQVRITGQYRRSSFILLFAGMASISLFVIRKQITRKRMVAGSIC